jgi:hypothetical protein
MQRRTQTHRTQNKHTDPNTKTIAQTPNIDVLFQYTRTQFVRFSISPKNFCKKESK